MSRGLPILVAAGGLFLAMCAADEAAAQKSGGILKVYHRDSPASMSILEEGTNSTEIPMMGVFNNLVMHDQHVAQNSLSMIVPDLATDWATSEDGKQLTFHLRQGVKWHDGKPFTANDVKCTWDLLTGKSGEKLRLNPRKSWYNNIEEMTTNGDNPGIRRAMMLSLDRKSFIDILAEGQGDIGGAMEPPPAWIWGMRASTASAVALMAMSMARQVTDELLATGRFDKLAPAMVQADAQRLFTGV